jgi:hypothetical protein
MIEFKTKIWKETAANLSQQEAPPPAQDEEYHPVRKYPTKL